MSIFRYNNHHSIRNTDYPKLHLLCFYNFQRDIACIAPSLLVMSYGRLDRFIANSFLGKDKIDKEQRKVMKDGDSACKANFNFSGHNSS
jgi:hypothetical protein